MAKHKNHDSDVLENPEAIADKLAGIESWAQRNPKIIMGLIGALVIVVGGFLFYRYYINRLDQQAQQQMFQAVHYFEADSLDLALRGDGNNLGFVDIISDFKGTKAANLANYYAGACFLKKGDFKTALLYLQDFSANDLLVQPRAYCLMGDAYMELKDYTNAASYYMKAADYQPNKYFTPGYLMKAAIAYEKLNEPAKAISAYDKIIKDYFDSSEYQDARKFKMRLEGNS